VQVGAAHALAVVEGVEAAVRLLPRQARRVYAGPGEPVAIRQGGDVAGHPRIEPRLTGDDVLGMEGEPRPQLETALRGDRPQPFEGGPGAFGIDVVRGEWGDPAPVVDAGLEQGPALARVRRSVHEVGRRLHPHLRPEHESGDRDGGAEVVESEVVGVPHRGLRLGPEVLDDDLLHRTEAPCGGPDGEDRLGALGQGLADAHEQPGRERDGEPARVVDHPQPDCRILVG
jgi:hypothetical protein